MDPIKRALRRFLRRRGYDIVKRGYPMGFTGSELTAGRPHVLVATHHKTGTVWMMSVFSAIARRTGSAFENINRYRDPSRVRDVIQSAINADHRHILLDWNAEFGDVDLPPRIRGIHLIRDPRDVVVSGAKYHTWSTERWLHEPRDEFGGLSYQEKINRCASADERQLFELDYKAKDTIERMLAFSDRGVFRTVKYESLIRDDNMIDWHAILVFLGFRGPELIVALEEVYRKSLFGGFDPRSRRHIHDGAVEQWKSSMSLAVQAAFRARFPDALQRLGYE